MDFVADWIKKRIGFIYAEHNSFQLELRLEKYILQNKLTSSSELIEIIKSMDRIEEQKFIEILVNNETYFFREPKFYEDLKKKIIPRLLEGKISRHLKFCSLACSSGQEVYSVAFICEQLIAEGLAFTYEILGTDISEPVLEKLKNGIYNKLEFDRGLNIDDHGDYFEIEGETFTINKKIRSKIDVMKLNLKDEFKLSCQYDMVLCRNVLYYLEKEVKQSLVIAAKKPSALYSTILNGRNTIPL